MSQEDIKKVVLKKPGEKFSSNKLSNIITSISINTIRVNMNKLVRDIENGYEDDICFEKIPARGRLGFKIFLFCK